MGICSDDSRIIVHSVKWSAGVLLYGVKVGRPKPCGWNLSSQIQNPNPGWKIFLERLVGKGQDNFVLKIGLQKHSSGGTVLEGLAYCDPPLPGKVIKQLFLSSPFKKKKRRKSSSLFVSCIRKQEKQSEDKVLIVIFINSRNVLFQNMCLPLLSLNKWKQLSNVAYVLPEFLLIVRNRKILQFPMKRQHQHNRLVPCSAMPLCVSRAPH